MITICLPYPSSALSPNSRGGWYTSAAFRREARQTGFVQAQETAVDLSGKPLEAIVTFHPPDRKRRDLDNAYSMCKPYQDGIFQAINADDCQLRRVTLSWGEPDRWHKGSVIFEIREIAP